MANPLNIFFCELYGCFQLCHLPVQIHKALEFIPFSQTNTISLFPTDESEVCLIIMNLKNSKGIGGDNMQ